VAPKSAADFAFLLHGFHYLKDEGVMAIILPHGVLFRGGAEERIRIKLLTDGNRCPLRGSHDNRSRTRPYSPSNPLRMSVTPAAK
jgi:N-6 DNA Methylase